MNKKKKSNFLN